jgi:hypothetical protein
LERVEGRKDGEGRVCGEEEKLKEIREMFLLFPFVQETKTPNNLHVLKYRD